MWATAPYFHNGSVPNIREVLRPAERKTVWRRVTTSPPAGSDLVMGFDSSLDAYDAERLGWKYEALPCDESGPRDCSVPEPESVGDSVDKLLSTGLAWNFVQTLPYADETIRDRMIYNTTRYSQSNSGHEFTSVLTDDEARAILEYLKML